jgi:hypothetical protein
VSKLRRQKDELYGNSLFEDAEKLNVVQARFIEIQPASFEELIRGYSSLKVLTYSSSVSIINKAAEIVDELEIVFGREDILHRMTQYVHYQEELIRELKQQFRGKDYIRQKLDAGKIHLYIVKEMISHEKLFLLEGETGTRVLSGSANFSEKAFSGNQNESFIAFDNDSKAWEYFSEKYQRIREKSSMSVAKRSVLDEQFDIEQLPVFDPENHDGPTPQFIVIPEKPPAPNIIHKLITLKTPKQYEGLNQVITSEKGVARIDKNTRLRAVQYVKSHVRTEEENPEEYLSIYPEVGRVVLSGKELDLNATSDAIKRDVQIILDYFDGYNQFRGNVEKLKRDYFTFMSWFYISPFICDFRNRAEAHLEYDLDKLDYPVFGILYGKSNCGKSELIKTLMLSMFQREGFLQNDWFTKGNVAGLREQNHRFPMLFDDMDKTRFSNHAIPLIKEDYISLTEYPAIVLSMNADKDTFESEVRKRCLIIYTGSSLPDHTGESRELGTKLKRMKRHLGDALYREYLRRVIERIEEKPPKDILAFSSEILYEIFGEHTDGPLPSWCKITTMDRYVQTKHDKVKDQLLTHVQHNKEAWSETGNNLVLRLEDIHEIRKLQKDVPDYLIHAVSGNAIIFLREELEEFLGDSVFAKRSHWWSRIWKRQ